MKRIFAFAASLAFASLAWAQPSLTGDSKPAIIAPQTAVEAAPGISFEKTTHEFGVIPQGVPATYRFVVTNTGKADLILAPDPNAPVKASCGCTTPKWTKEPIKPGETGYVEATYNAASAGMFNKSITVPNNAGAPMVLHLKGEVKNDAVNVSAPASGPVATPGGSH